MEGEQNTKLIKRLDETIDQLYMKIGNIIQTKKEVSNLNRSRLGFICDESSSKFGRRLFTKCDVCDFFAELDAEITTHETKISNLEALKLKVEQQPEPSPSPKQVDNKKLIRPVTPEEESVPITIKDNNNSKQVSKQATSSKPTKNNHHQQKTTWRRRQKQQPRNQHQYSHHFNGYERFHQHYNQFACNGIMPLFPNNGRPGPSYPSNRNVYCPPRMIGNVFVPNQNRRNHAMNSYRQRGMTYL